MLYLYCGRFFIWNLFLSCPLINDMVSVFLSHKKRGDVGRNPLCYTRGLVTDRFHVIFVLCFGSWVKVTVHVVFPCHPFRPRSLRPISWWEVGIPISFHCWLVLVLVLAPSVHSVWRKCWRGGGPGLCFGTFEPHPRPPPCTSFMNVWM